MLNRNTLKDRLMSEILSSIAHATIKIKNDSIIYPDSPALKIQIRQP